MQEGQFAAMLGAGDLRWGRLITRTERALRRPQITPVREGNLRFWLGVALFETGDLLRAEQELQRVNQLGGEFPDLAQRRAEALFRLGMIYRLLRRPHREAESFREAADRFTALGLAEGAIRSRVAISWSLLLAGCAIEALPWLEGAAAGLAALDAPEEMRVDLGIAQAFFLSLMGDRQTSDSHCFDLLGRPPLRPVQRADIAWILGCNALAAKDRTAAELHAGIAHSYAVAAWWPPQLARVDQLRQRLESVRGASVQNFPRL